MTRLADLLPASLLAFVACAYALPTEPAYADAFYLLVAPPALAWLALRRPIPWRAAPVALTFALLAWSAASLAWGQDVGHRSARFALASLDTTVFFVALLVGLATPAQRRRLGDLLVPVGAANALLSLALGLLTVQNGPRLHGWGVTSHPILGATAMALAYLTAVARGLAEAGAGPRRRALNLAAAAAMAGFMLMTESRGPLLAAGLATLLIAACGPWRWRALAALAALAGAWALLPARMHRHEAFVITGRGASHHIEIWSRSLDLIRERPLIGHGLAFNLDLPDYTFPHDLYLSLLLYSGAIGLGLFVALVAVVGVRAARLTRAPEFLWLCALGIDTLVAGLTDLGQITKGPGPMWFILWIPLGLLLGFVRAGGRSDAPWQQPSITPATAS